MLGLGSDFQAHDLGLGLELYLGLVARRVFFFRGCLYFFLQKPYHFIVVHMCLVFATMLSHSAFIVF